MILLLRCRFSWRLSRQAILANMIIREHCQKVAGLVWLDVLGSTFFFWRFAPNSLDHSSWTGRIMGTEPMIELHDIELIFDNEKRKWPWSKPTETRTIFNGLNARIDEGHAVALRGVNGCGKTTLLRLIYGALLPSRGEVRVLGTPTSAWRHPHPAVALLYPRDWVLQWRLTIRQNLEFFG